MISRYSTIKEEQMKHLMYYHDVQSITQKRGEIAMWKSKMNLSTKSSDLANLCQARENMIGHHQLELRLHQ
jgi:hypothetical protein